jgi:hydrogenase maturation factor
MPREHLMSPLSSNEIATILGNIRDASATAGVELTTAHTAVEATVKGMREWCGATEVTIGVMSFAGLAPRPADLVAN